jgi:hypothetical protein
MKNILILFILSFGFLSSCTELENGLVDTNAKPVVEAYLSPGTPVSIRIYKEIPYAEVTTANANKEVPIENLKITLKGPESSVLLNSLGSGLYTAPASFKILVGKEYSMKFDYNGMGVYASTMIPSKPINYKADKDLITRQAIDLSQGGGGLGGRPGGNFNQAANLTLTWSNPTNDYFISVIENMETNPVEIVKFPVDPTRVRPDIRFRNEPVQGTTVEIRPQNFQYFGFHRVILFKLNPDYVALYKRNGNTTQNISTPPTTITNGLGIFTGINSDTLKVRVIPE